MRRGAIATVLIGVMAAGPALADRLSEKSEELESLRERIGEIEDALAEDRNRRQDVSGELRRLEKKLGGLAGEVRRMEQRMDRKQDRVSELRARYRRESERLAGQRRYLREQVRAAFFSGREEYLRLLLNQERPDRLDRMLVYYDYLNQARTQRIRGAIDALAELRGLRQRLETEIAELETLRTQRQRRLETLRRRQDEREALLARLRERIEGRDERLARLRADAERLSDLVARLRRELADIPDNGDGGPPFAARQGELDWPLSGPLLGRYGERRSERLRWAGLLIGADRGEPVRAVARGRVVFADWLRGLGLLIIIDHGNGYMTLYGHNQSLYSEVGDWVAGGEVVAAVGASGGRDRDALYFEVRSSGKPVNPMAWLGPQPDAG